MSNNKNAFEGSEEQKKELYTLIEENKLQRGGLMPILHGAQEIYGYLPIEVQKMIAEALDMSLSEVYGVVTFYSHFSLEPKGKYQVSVCLGTACYVKGAAIILEEIEKVLGISDGECTEDNLFSIDSTRCVGACALAPVILVNDDVYGKVTRDEVAGIIKKYKDMEAGV